MLDYYLRFTNEAESIAVANLLNAISITDEGPRLVRFTKQYALDVIGELVLSATLDTNGNQTTPAKTLPGWHVNMRILDGSPLPPELEQYVVTPETPYRVWA
jgi:hypothetical protein